jgi:hypothetical protein
VEAKFAKHTKHDLVDLVHKAKCGMLKDLKVDDMTKEEIISHLIKSKCPVVKEFLKKA